MASGEFNNDGRLDVAVSGEFFSSYQTDILLGNGDGTFTPDGYYTVSATPQSIATGYFTSDKTKLDLAVANQLGGSLSVLLGNGDGTFQPSVYYDTSFPTWVIAQDMNGDGEVDLVASNPGLLGGVPAILPGVSVLKGNGDGTFQPGVFYPAGTNRDDLNYVAAGDFNGDGKTDLVLVDNVGSQVITLLNTGSATFSPTTPLTFQGQLLGTTSAPQTATLTNSGTGSMTISSVKSTGAPFRMTETTCKGSLAPGAQCTITAEFTARALGTVGGTVTLNDSASSKPQVVELIGIGSELDISPAKLTFPTQKVGTKSAPRTIRLTNVGTTDMAFTHFLYIDGGNGYNDFSQTNDCGSSLAPKASCTINVVFGPHQTGALSSLVHIEDDGGDSPQLLQLSGIGN
jgi:hypothetical protein